MLQVPTDARCLRCDYALHCLETSRCPECGYPFDPSDPGTLRLPGDLRDRWRVAVAELGAGIAWAACVLSVSCPIFATLGRTFSARPSWLIPSLLVAGAVRPRVRRYLLGRRHNDVPDVHEPRRNALLLVLYLMLLVSGLEVRRCDHGALVGISPISIARSDIGGPCRYGSYRVSWRLIGNWYVSIG